MVRLYSIFLLVVAAFITSCNTTEDDAADAGSFNTAAYEQRRAEKDNFFKTSDQSPLPQSIRGAFKGLPYYPPSAEFAVEAEFVLQSVADTVEMNTSTGDIRKAIQVGLFEFTVAGTEQQLFAYQFLDGDAESLFVPFQDATTGGTTYATGRYLDVPIGGEIKPTYTLDFNDAYNPFCAYSDRYSCPLVPADNVLDIAIMAGEKAWKH